MNYQEELNKLNEKINAALEQMDIDSYQEAEREREYVYQMLQKEIISLKEKIKNFPRHGGCTNRTRDFENMNHRLDELNNIY